MKTCRLFFHLVFACLTMMALDSVVIAGHFDMVPYASGTGPGAQLLTGDND